MAFSAEEPVFSGVTMRLGRRWLEHFEDGQTRVVLLNCLGRVRGVGEIYDVLYCPVGYVGPGMLGLTTPDEVLELLAKTYPDAQVDEQSYVTIALYLVEP